MLRLLRPRLISIFRSQAENAIRFSTAALGRMKGGYRKAANTNRERRLGWRIS